MSGLNSWSLISFILTFEWWCRLPWCVASSWWLQDVDVPLGPTHWGVTNTWAAWWWLQSTGVSGTCMWTDIGSNALWCQDVMAWWWWGQHTGCEDMWTWWWALPCTGVLGHVDRLAVYPNSVLDVRNMWVGWWFIQWIHIGVRTCGEGQLLEVPGTVSSIMVGAKLLTVGTRSS